MSFTNTLFSTAGLALVNGSTIGSTLRITKALLSTTQYPVSSVEHTVQMTEGFCQATMDKLQVYIEGAGVQEVYVNGQLEFQGRLNIRINANENLTIKSVYIVAEGTDGAPIILCGLFDKSGLPCVVDSKMNITSNLVVNIKVAQGTNITFGSTVEPMAVQYDELDRFVSCHLAGDSLRGTDQVIYGCKTFENGLGVTLDGGNYFELSDGLEFYKSGSTIITDVVTDEWHIQKGATKLLKTDSDSVTINTLKTGTCYIGGTRFTSATSGTNVQCKVLCSNFIPAQTASSIGASSNKWQQGYFNYIYGTYIYLGSASTIGNRWSIYTTGNYTDLNVTAPHNLNAKVVFGKLRDSSGSSPTDDRIPLECGAITSTGTILGKTYPQTSNGEVPLGGLCLIRAFVNTSRGDTITYNSSSGRWELSNGSVTTTLYYGELSDTVTNTETVLPSTGMKFVALSRANQSASFLAMRLV